LAHSRKEKKAIKETLYRVGGEIGLWNEKGYEICHEIGDKYNVAGEIIWVHIMDIYNNIPNDEDPDYFDDTNFGGKGHPDEF